MQRLPISWIAVAVLWLTYTLLGWHLSAYHFAWLILSFLAAVLLNLSLTKEGREIGELFSFGPRSLITIFLLSTTVTLAVAASSVFALILILLAAELLARVELQVAGLDRSRAFWIMLLLASLGLGVGWWFGSTLLPSSRYWIYG